MSRQGESRERTHENIQKFWDAEAADWGESPRVTIRDHFFRLHELHTLLSLIPRTSRLLDVGCGTGFGTLVLARRARLTLGLDYSARMVQWAERLRDDDAYRERVVAGLSPLWGVDVRASAEVRFMVADVQNLEPPRDAFDIVTGQRILINLPTHDDQMKALRNLRRCAGADAWLLLVEATEQGHARTDQYRALFGLPMLEKYWHNNYVDETRYCEWERHGWRVAATLGFDTYMLLSKVVYPAACGSSNCEFLSGANEAAMEVANTFRTKAAAAEKGTMFLLGLFADRVQRYSADEARMIRGWVDRNGRDLPDWSGLGHQQLIMAVAC